MKLIYKIKLTLLVMHVACGFCAGQSSAINFHHLSPSDGLSDGVVRCIGQDKYGYIWIGTLSGLSRYNGYNVNLYQNIPGDSTSLPYGGVHSILGDGMGNLWIGGNRGLYKFDYATSKFLLIKGSKQYRILRMLEKVRDTIYMSTVNGLALFIPSTQKITYCGDQEDSVSRKLLHYLVNDFCFYKENVYATTDSGLVIMNIATKKATLGSLRPQNEKRLNRITIDHNGNLWASFGVNSAYLLKTDLSFSKIEVFNDFYYSLQRAEGSTINWLYTDTHNRVWITSSFTGLVQYDEDNHRFIHYMNDPTQQGSVVANHMLQVFQDYQGFIWVGSEGYGVDYFNPDKNFVNVIASSTMAIPGLTSNWGRTAVEDRQGALWLGWVGGLTRVSADGKSVRLWQNVKGETPHLHYNSIRSLLCDDKGDIWICTTGGINRYHPATDKMDYLDEKDSLPGGFYWTIIQDSRKNFWIGERSNLYYYDAAEKKFHTAAYHPVLSQIAHRGVRSIMEDSKHRIWFGMNGWGLAMYDPEKNILKQWTRTDTNDTTVVGNFSTSIAEDKNGIIWIGSFIGMVAYDPQKDKFTQYTRRNGLASNKTSCLMVDKRNRLWIGTTSGLLLLDSSRSHFKNFDLHDGLPTMEFNDQDAYRMRDGRFIFPSMKGFVVFDGDKYEENIKIPALYISSIKVHNNELASNSNYEETKQLTLGHDENFFSIELAALNYVNPQQTWYAYKLDPFDKDWMYTKERLTNYTNVPGGNYLFHYKATNNPNNWEVPEKILSISIGTVYYKTIWFWTLIGLAVLIFLYWLYRVRLEQQQRIYSLQTRAQALEKEKALVMYEGLKQQLNPHFLFNSLTSLSSLIRTNQKLAGAFLDGLSKSYRYILKSRNNEVVPLVDEIKFAEIYIKLQQTRFEKGLHININVGENFYDLRIAPVTLQHLIENAIKHNIIDDESPLVIDIFVEEDFLIVRNNLQRKNFVESSNKQGLINLQSLYHYLSGRPVEIMEDEKYFTVKIPLI